MRLGRTKKIIFRKIKFSGTLFLFCLFLSSTLFTFSSEASILKQINYQGKLTDLSDVAVGNGSYSMILRIYRTSDGTCLWSARGTCGTPTARSVQVTDGIFSIALGDTVAGDNAINLDFSEGYELGVKVGADTEMTPRKKLSSAPQAFNASNLIADGIINLDNTSTAADAANISYNPASGAYDALNISYGSGGGTGTALNVLQSGTGYAATIMGGNVGIGVSSPTAILSLASATTSAASLNIASGTAPTGGNLHEGDIWYDGTHLYFKPSGTVKDILAGGGGGMSIGDTLGGSPIDGSVLFVSNSGQLSQDNNNFFWDNSAKRLGIGTTGPTSNLTIDSNGLDIAAAISIKSYGQELLKLNASHSAGTGTLSGAGGIIFAPSGGVSTIGQLRLDAVSNVVSVAGQYNGDTGKGDSILFQGGAWNGNAVAGDILFRGGYGGGTQGNIKFQSPDGIADYMTILPTGNVGIGVTNPTAFLDLAAATSAEPSMNISSSAGTNPASHNTGDLWFNGSNLFFMKDAVTSVDLLTSVGSQWINNGNDIYYGSNVSGDVGIGTSTPGAVLEINGGAREMTGLKISNLDIATMAIDLSASGMSGSSDYLIYKDTNNYWRADGQFSTAGSVYASNFFDYANTAYYFDPGNTSTGMTMAGKAGIGTTAPDNMLSINQSSSGANPVVDFMTNGSTIFSEGVDALDFNKFKIQFGASLTGSTPPFVINSTGQIGMGTNNPDNLLTLNVVSGNPIIDFEVGSVDKFVAGVDTADSNKFKIEYSATGVLGSATPAFVINSASQVGIGTPNPTTLFNMVGGQFTLGPLNATTAAQIFFQEASNNGTTYVGLKSPDLVAASFTLTLPNALGTSGQVLQTDNSGNLSWAANAATGMSNPMTTTGDLILAGASGTPTRLPIGSNTQCLTIAAGVVGWGTCATGAAAGATTQVIFNNAGSMAGNANFTWDNTNFTLSSLGTIAGAKISMALQNSNAGATASNELRIGNDTTANALSLLVNSSGFTGAANYAYIYNKTATGPMLFGTNNTERMRIDASGNVGIGIAAPTAKLHIVDNVITAGNTILATTTSITSGNFVQLSSTATTATTNQTILNISNTGILGTASQTTYGMQVTNTHTGTSETDYGALFTVNGGSGNASINYGVGIAAMTGDTSTGLNIVSMGGVTTNIGVNIGAITNGGTTDTGLNITSIAGGGTGASIVTGLVTSTGANAYQLNLGGITANNTAHYGINIGAIAGTATNAYGINLGTIAAGSTGTYGVAVGAMTGANAASSNYGLYVANIGTTTATLDAGLAIANQSGIATNVYGLNVGTISGAAGTNTGLFIGAISAATATKYEINTTGITGNAAGTNTAINLGGISGSTAGTASNNQLVTGAVSGVATNNYQLNLSTVTGGTTSNSGINLGAVSGTATNNYGLNLGTVTGGTAGNYGINVAAVTGVATATNVGINLAGLANPNTGTVYGIRVAANTTVSGSATASYGMQITGPTGASAANYGLNVVMPTVGTHISGITIGAVVATAGTWALYSNAANNSYFAGNVGFGTTTPGSAADIKGTLRLSGATSGFVGLMGATNAGSTVFTLPSADGANGNILQTNGLGVLSWTPNTTGTGMTNVLTTTGDLVYSSAGTTAARLGIGTNGKCLVSNGTIPGWANCPTTGSAAGSDTSVQYNNSTSLAGDTNYIYNYTNYTLSVLGSIAGAKTSMVLRNMNAGVTSTNEFQVGNDAYANDLSLLVNSSGFTNNVNNAYIFNKSTVSPGALILGTNNVERLRIDGNGNIGIAPAGSYTNAAPPLSALDITRNAIAAVQNDTYGLTLNNNTAAANNAQQWSPAIRFRGYGWAGASNTFDIREYVRPVQATPLIGALDFQSSSNGGAYVDLMSLLGGANGGTLSIGSNAPAATTTRLNIVDNVVTTGSSILDTTNSLTSGNFMQLTENGSLGATNQTILNILNTGANNTSSITTYGLQVSNTHTGTTPTNVAATFTATGGSTNYGARVLAMTGATNTGLDIGTMAGVTSNIALNIGAISAGGTTDSAITISTIAGGGTGSALTSGAVSTTGGNAYQLNLGTITGNNSAAHYGIALGAISGVTPTAYGLSLSTLTGGTGTMAQIVTGAITGGSANAYGINIGAISGATTAIYGINIGSITTTGAPNSYGINVTAMTGAGGNAAALNIPTFATTGSTNYGINVGGLTGAGNNNYGIYVGTISGSQTGKYSIQTGGLTGNATGTNTSVSLGAIASSVLGTVLNSQITTGAVGGVATNNYQLNLSTVTGGTAGNYVINLGAVTSIAGATNVGINVAAGVGVAAATSYGVKIAGPTTAGTANYGLNVIMPSGATNNSGLVIGAAPVTVGNWAVYSAAPNNSYFASNVGIGVLTPAVPLDIKAAAAATMQIEPFGVAAGNTGEERFMALNSTSYIGLKAPDTISSNFTLTWPNALPTVTGYVLSSTTAGVMSWTPNNAASAMANPMTTTGDLIFANSTAVPANPARLGIGTAGQCLIVSGTSPAWGACTNSVVAAGSPTWIQFNSAGSFGASSNFVWDNANYTLSSIGAIVGAKVSLALQNSNNGTTSTNELRVGNDTTANALSLLVNSSTFTNAVNNGYIMNKTATGALAFGANSLERMRIDAGGNIGIGPSGSFTNAIIPLSSLDVTNNTIAANTAPTDSYGLTLNDNTAAANASQRFSPELRFRGYGYTGAASQSMDIRAFVRPIQTAPLTGSLDFQSQVNGGGYFDLMSLVTGTNGGILSLGSNAPAATISRLNILDNVVSTGNSILDSTNSLTSGSLVALTSATTLAAASQTILNISTSGTNSTAGITTYGAQIADTHAGSTSTNIAGLFTATGGTTANIGVQIASMTTTTATNTGVNIIGMTTAGAATNIGVAIGAISGTTSGNNTGLSISTISGAATANTGISLGAISSTGATNLYGINMGAITTSNVTGSYAINIAAMTGTGAATGIFLNAMTPTGATNNYGVNIGGLSDAAATSNTGLYIGSVTGSTTANYQLNTAAMAAVAASTNYGINLGGVTGAVLTSTNYGMKIGAVSATTGTANYGLNVISPTGATHNSSLVIGTPVTTAGSWALYSADTNKSYFAGSVGIGTSTPIGQLQVAATVAPTADMMTISNVGFGVATAGVSALEVNYVGGANAIEASSIRSDIAVGATSGSTWNAIRLVGSTAASGVTENALKIDVLTPGAGTENAINIGTGWDYGIYSNTTGSSYLAGNLGIAGATVPAAKLAIGAANGTSSQQIHVLGQGTTSATYGIYYENSTPTLNFDVDDSGAGYLRAASWTYGSDRRLKENISATNYGLAEVMQLNPMKFDYINGEKNDLGFIAQDVQTVLPELVVTQANGMLGLKTDMLIPVLVNAIKTQQSEIQDNVAQLGQQGMQLSEITLKTDQSITTLAQLQSSIDQQLGVIQSKFDDANQKIDSQDQRVATLENLAADLQTQIDDLKKQTNQDLNLAQIETNKTDIDYLKLLLGFDRVKNNGDVSLLGSLEANGVVAGAFTVKVVDTKSPTIGEAIILAVTKDDNKDGVDDVTGSDGQSIEIKTKAVSDTSKIFLSPKSKKALSYPLTITETKNGEYFKVEVPEAVKDDLTFDWWIVDSQNAPQVSDKTTTTAAVPAPAATTSQDTTTVPAPANSQAATSTPDATATQ